jgi:RNA polymerase sigma factor (TIGR02999 family)
VGRPTQPPSPSAPAAGEVTLLLQAWSRGDLQARDRLIPVVYAELRRRAAAALRRERRLPTLRPTELVHEAYFRMCAPRAGWEGRQHFFALAANLMRQVLIDHARAAKAVKRGRALCVTLSEAQAASPPPDVDLLALDEALEALGRLDPRQERLVELRFFGGLTVEEAAAAEGVSVATAHREWALAKAWLYRRLKQSAR